MRVHVPMDHMEGTVLVFESKVAANARVHARTHANQYRIPSICSLQCLNATCVDCESLTPTRGATQQSVDCESLTPTRGATQQSVDCESLTPTRGATQQSVDSKIVRVSSIAPEGWGPKKGGNVTSPLHSRGSPNKGGQNQKSKPPLGVTMMPLGAPSISKYGSLVRGQTPK